MKLEDLGYHSDLETFRQTQQLQQFGVARVISEHKERYHLQNEEGEFEGILLGQLRFNAVSREDFPAVGDWVAISPYDEGKVLIHAIFPRHSILERQAVGKTGQKQIIGTNIDYGLIVQAVGQDFNLNRLERYLTICHSAKVKPLIILSKIDLVDEDTLDALIGQITERIPNVPLFPISNLDQQGYDALTPQIKIGKTYCLLGSSGVGKSSLLNALAGVELMETSHISAQLQKGRHTTTHRSLSVLKNGAILIDNPGMREVGLSDVQSGLTQTFEDIERISQDCKYKDCQHLSEDSCAVLEAIDNGQLDPAVYDNYQKMKREQTHFSASIEEKRRKDKAFGKMIKQVIKQRKKDKF